MNSTPKILTIIDAENDPALVVDRACWLARLLGSELELLLCDASTMQNLKPFLTSSQAQRVLSEATRVQDELLARLVAQAQEHGIDASTNVLGDPPIAGGILDYVAKSRPALVVKGTHYHSASERSIIIGTDWRLIRKCSAPLYLVKAATMTDSPTVVAAVDPLCEHDKPATLDQAIVDHARSITEPGKGRLLLFHSYERLAAIGAAAAHAVTPEKLPIDEINQRIKTEHRAALNEFARKNDIDPEATHQLPGRTHELLPAFVRSKGADIVVIGALARWGMRRMILGSTTERVLDHLPCDLLVVRATGGDGEDS